MTTTRRRFLNRLLPASAWLWFSGSWLKVGQVWADWPKPLFNQSSYQHTLTTLFADRKITDTTKIRLKLPRIAENGANVPLSIRCQLPDIQRIYVLVEHNPHPLSARFQLSPFLDPVLSVRLKMAKSSPVIVIAEDNKGALFRARQKVKVTVGGCGD